MYWLELAGETDAFATYEAASVASGVEIVAPGIARADVVGSGAPQLAYTHAALESIGRCDPTVDDAVRLLRIALSNRSVDEGKRSGDPGGAGKPAGTGRSGSVAVRARDVRATTGVSTGRAERELGQVLVDRGFSVDLDDPDHVLRALFAAGERPVHEAVAGADGEHVETCTLGWIHAEADREFAPAPTDRPFFQPGSMDPIDARAYVNLAGAGPGRILLDPMCGTGGLPIEAGLVGARVIAADAQPKMVEGTRRNLQTYLSGEWDVLRADATALPLSDGGVDCVAFDAPYGRQSKIERHELSDLIAGALSAAGRVSDRAVMVADRDWRGTAIDAGWRVDALFERRVHRSLTRYVHVLTADDSNGTGRGNGDGKEATIETTRALR
ncbi:methyltransferase domain-containing protein [Halopenitus sp. H-Gu1]|uniref:methyltransferase domain-containing protein n=1 Tax=Halopenitus sp. H-Gu1 TaxID=3242697 RepID=UPI00359E58E0